MQQLSLDLQVADHPAGRLRGSWLPLGIAITLVAACTDAPSGPVPSSSVERPVASASAFRWVEVPIDDPKLDGVVAEHARSGRDLGLTPVVHMRTPWNTGGRLVKHREHPDVQRALAGLYLIEIEVGDHEAMCEGDGCTPRWASADLLCGTFAQTFHAVGLDGRPSAPSGSPGKLGPTIAAHHVAMLDDYRELLRVDPGARCAGLRGPSR